MPVSAVSGSNPSDQAGISQSEFLRLLLTQLQNQDPLKPVDNKDFVVQMAQFSALAQTQQINQSVSALLSFQASSQSIGLLGKRVDVANADGSSSSGTVTGISFLNADPQLTVQIGAGINIQATMAQITAVRPATTS